MAKSHHQPLSPAIDIYHPVPFDLEATKAEWMQDPEFCAAYAAQADEFAALDALLAARKAAGLTQAEVAARMGIKPSSLARIEGSLGNPTSTPPRLLPLAGDSAQIRPRPRQAVGNPPGLNRARRCPLDPSHRRRAYQRP